MGGGGWGGGGGGGGGVVGVVVGVEGGEGGEGGKRHRGSGGRVSVMSEKTGWQAEVFLTFWFPRLLVQQTFGVRHSERHGSIIKWDRVQGRGEEERKRRRRKMMHSCTVSTG